MEAGLEPRPAAAPPLAEDSRRVHDELVVDAKVGAVIGVHRETVFPALGDRPPASPTDTERHLGDQGLVNLSVLARPIGNQEENWM